LGIIKSEKRHRYIKRRKKVTFTVPNNLLIRLCKSAENISEVLPLYVFGIVIKRHFWHTNGTYCVSPNFAARDHYHNVVQNTWRSREIKTIRLWHSAFRADAVQHCPSSFLFFLRHNLSQRILKWLFFPLTFYFYPLFLYCLLLP
jgi:hypothetical protein